VYHIDEAVAAQASINLGMIIGIIVVILAIIILVLILYALRGRPQASTAISDNYSNGLEVHQVESLGIAVIASDEPKGDDTIPRGGPLEGGQSIQMVGNNEKTTILQQSKPGPVLALLFDQDDSDKIYSLHQHTTTIGRTKDNQVVLDDPNVSGRHARIDLVNDTFQLHDLGATNPAKLNGQGIESYSLQNDDVIEIGQTKLIFKRVTN
jgi:hypothetical protein